MNKSLLTIVLLTICFAIRSSEEVYEVPLFRLNGEAQTDELKVIEEVLFCVNMAMQDDHGVDAVKEFLAGKGLKGALLECLSGEDIGWEYRGEWNPDFTKEITYTITHELGEIWESQSGGMIFDCDADTRLTEITLTSSLLDAPQVMYEAIGEQIALERYKKHFDECSRIIKGYSEGGFREAGEYEIDESGENYGILSSLGKPWYTFGGVALCLVAYFGYTLMWGKKEAASAK